QINLIGRVVAQQVQRHVVGRRELALHRHLLAGGGLEDGAEVDVRLLEDDAVPDGVDTTPSGSTHQLGELAGGQGHEVPTIELREGRDHASTGRHVNAERERFGSEDDFDQATLEEILDQLL